MQLVQSVTRSLMSSPSASEPLAVARDHVRAVGDHPVTAAAAADSVTAAVSRVYPVISGATRNSDIIGRACDAVVARVSLQYVVS